MGASSPIRFGGFELDLRTGELRKHGVRLKIQDQPLQVLQALVEQPGELVTREELRTRIWAHGTFVDFDQGLNRAINKVREVLSDDAEVPHFIETLPRRGYRFIAHVEARPKPGPAVSNPSPEAAIAVLPFANLSHDADDEYFSDGLAGEIISALTQTSGLKVIARTSAFAFKGKNEDIRKIAQALGVDNVLEGSVRRAGSRVRVNAQLIHAVDGTHLWSERYDRELTDIFALQDEIAAAIVGTLVVKLNGPAAMHRPHEPSLRAYEALLKARHYQHRLYLKTWEEQSALIDEYFKQAIELDPHWADPHSEFGQLCLFRGGSGPHVGEMISLARSEARKALELLPSEPNAHALLGAIAASHDYDWKEAGEQFKLARAPESVSPSVRHLYAGFYLSPLGRFEEALQQMDKAIAQDPLNMLFRGRQLLILLFAEMYEPAILEAQKELEFDGCHIGAHSMIALTYFFQGNLAEAREWAEEAFRRTPMNGLAMGLLAGLLKRSGEKHQWEKLMSTLRGFSPLGMIISHLVCSEIDAAIDCYEHAIEQRQPFAAGWASAGFFRPLRSSPRWPRLARMMNLPERC